jgi:hypothetical protein
MTARNREGDGFLIVVSAGRAALAVLVAAALLLASPIGSGGVALAAGGGHSGQESRLEREVDGLSPEQRAGLEQRLWDRLEAAGIDLTDPKIQAQLAATLGVSKGEVARTVDESEVGTEGAVSGVGPIVLLFVAAALIFAPEVFKSVAGTLYEWLTSEEGIEGLEPFGG